MQRRVRVEYEEVIFNAVGYLYLTLLMFACLFPFLLMIAGSLTDEASIIKYGYQIVPSKVSLEAYQTMFRNFSDIARAFLVSTLLVSLGTVTSLFVVSMASYALFRKDFEFRGLLALVFFFTNLFQPGLVPIYIWMVRYLHLKNTFLALMLPSVLNVWNLFLLRNFMMSTPPALVDSARIDGAGDFRIYLKIILPLAIPGLVTVGLFQALWYWNDWYHAMLYIDQTRLYPIQYYLYNILNRSAALERVAAETGQITETLPAESLKLAVAVVATGPVILLYPFAQRFFIRGLTIGAIKG